MSAEAQRRSPRGSSIERADNRFGPFSLPYGRNPVVMIKGGPIVGKAQPQVARLP